MPTALTPKPAAPAYGHGPVPGAGRRPCRFSLQTTGDPDAVVRVLMALRRRGCQITGVEFVAADRHGPGHLEIAVRAPYRVAHRLENLLLALVDVTAVRSLDAARLA